MSRLTTLAPPPVQIAAQDPTASTVESGSVSAPGWFRKARSTQQLRSQLMRIERQAEEEPALTIGQRILRFVRQARLAVLTALLAHLALLAVLACITFAESFQQERLSLVSLTEENAVDMELETEMTIEALVEELPEIAPDSEPSPSLELEQPTISVADQPDMDQLLADLQQTIPGGNANAAGSGDGTDGVGEPQKLIARPGRNAVTRGSFTVWTTPEDPRPGEPYTIAILIKVPDRVKKFPLGDLRGSFVDGTDFFRADIPHWTQERKAMRVQNGQVVYRLAIPGASQYVKDTIYIKSAMLDESHTIVIEF